MTLEEAKKCSIACVYCLEFPNGKKYVDKSKELSKRVSLYERFGHSSVLDEAINEFGWDNINIAVLSEVKCRNSVDLDVCLSMLEIKYIREFDTLSPNGYNISLGGEVLGIPVECITTDADIIKARNGCIKPIIVYDLNGDFVKEYPSVASFSYEHGIEDDVVSRAVGKNKVFCDKWVLRFKKYDYCPQHIEISPTVKEHVVYKDVVVERERIKNIITYNHVTREVERRVVVKPHVLKYDMDGKFCGEYDSFKDACMSFLNSSSGITCGMYRKGYILFKKREDDYPLQIEPYSVLSKKILGDYYVPSDQLEDKVVAVKRGESKMRRGVGRPRKEHSSGAKEALRVNGKYTNIQNNFPIIQSDLDGNFIARYDSIRDASSETGLSYANIWACVHGRTKKAAGYKWSADLSDNF